MPASTKLQETYGDDLQVIFIESQRASPAQAESFTLARRWLGGRSMWTSEHPFETGATSLPFFVLLGNDGRVLLKGNPLSQSKEIERQIAEEIKNRKSAPREASKYVQAAWSDLHSGRIAKAFESLEEVAQRNAQDPAVLEVVRQTAQEFRARVERELARAQWLIDHGHFDEAALLVDELRRSSKGEAEFFGRCGELAARLEDPRLKPEREAARALARLLPEFFKTGGGAGPTAELVRFTQKYAGTRAAEQAEHWVGLARG